MSTSGCNPATPATSLVLTQAPVRPAAATPAPDVLDERYPAGSRVVLAVPGSQPGAVRILSKGLLAAGAPVVSPSGKRVLFTGKGRSGEWQIYEANLAGRNPRVVTAMDGGAMDPAFSAYDEIIFSSPVPKVGATWTGKRVPALYALKPGGAPRRLTFGASGAVEPTVLRDGRVLFVSAWSRGAGSEPSLGLFTINNDGTELTPFALNRDGAPFVRRPRELDHGRIGFIASKTSEICGEAWPESVRMARPFASRAPLGALASSQCRSIESGEDGKFLICMPRTAFAPSPRTGAAPHRNPLPEPRALSPVGRAYSQAALSSVGRAYSRAALSSVGRAYSRAAVVNGVFKTARSSPSSGAGGGRTLSDSFAVIEMSADTSATFIVIPARAQSEPGTVLFDDPDWNEIEAVRLTSRPRPMGHISAIDPKKKTGTILCLDANFTRPAPGKGAKADRIRVVSGGIGQKHSLGEVPLQPDGSFMAEVPADTPIGFEALDVEGRVLRRLEPSLWLRPGENRACLGCHEPYNRSPRNIRPMAVTALVAPLAHPTNSLTSRRASLPFLPSAP